jgi:hypothetical protein
MGKQRISYNVLTGESERCKALKKPRIGTENNNKTVFNRINRMGWRC